MVRCAIGVAVALMVTATPTASAVPVDCAVVRCVALTFDDGPGPHTDRLLQTLRDHGGRATFFLIGDKVAADPAAARRIADAGMEVGNHTWSHPNMTMLAPQGISAQFSAATTVLETAIGQRPTLARTGGGHVDDAVLAEAGRQGLAVVNWDVVPYDWIHDDDTAATRELLTRQIRPNAVVLLHDTFGSTVDLMGEIVPWLKAGRDFGVVAVAQRR